MADDGDDEPIAQSEEEEGEGGGWKKKKKKKKGNWKNIGHAPVNYAAYPCECRWKVKFPKDPCIKYKQVRWVAQPLSDRIKQLALPTLRRLLALWLEFGDKLPPEMRARLMGLLMTQYGLTEEFLEKILEEAVKARQGLKDEEEGEKKVKEKKEKKRASKGSKGGKRKKGSESEEKKKGKTKDEGLGFQRRKAGKLPLDWPYKMGSKFMLMCISILSQDPDEDFNSRATEYFDVQSMGILEQMCKYMDMPLPDPERPTQYGETLVIMALNLSDWIAKYIVAPAQEIPDDKVDEYLSLYGDKPKQKKEKGDKGKNKKPKSPPPEPAESSRGWGEMKSPTYKPPKTRISKRTPMMDDDETESNALEIETNIKKNDLQEEEGIPRWQVQNLDNVKNEFLEYINWYNPWEPEFMYLGPKITPTGVEMYKIYDAESDEVPADLRVLNWSMAEHGYVNSYSFIPSPVPPYYPCLRPLRPIRLEDVERSGIPKDVIKQNLRFFSPWYIMSRPLKAPDPEPNLKSELDNQNEVGESGDSAVEKPEAEEQFEDEMLQPSGPAKVKDSLWGDSKMMEQLEILGHIIHLSSSVPDLTIEHVLELLEEFCDAVKCAESDENPSEENKLNLKKRTIILEQYYVNFFGKKWRDYDDTTRQTMRTICWRIAYYVQLLYEYTARNLWELQSQPNLPTPLPMTPEEPDDPQALQDWDEWLAWLLKVTKTCDEWAGWISETVDEAEKKAAKKKGEYIGPDGKPEILSRKEWFGWKKNVEGKVYDYRTTKKLYNKESPYYLDKAKEILPVKHRQVKKLKKFTGEYRGEAGEGEDMDVWKDIGEDYGGETQYVTETDTTAGETEYEDVTEND